MGALQEFGDILLDVQVFFLWQTANLGIVNGRAQ